MNKWADTIEFVTEKLRSDHTARAEYARAWVYGFMQSLDRDSLLYRAAHAVIVDGVADIESLVEVLAVPIDEVKQILKDLEARLRLPSSRAYFIEPPGALEIDSFEELCVLLEVLTAPIEAHKQSIALQFKKWGEFLLPPSVEQPAFASAASEQIDSEEEDTELLVTFTDEHSGAEISIAIVHIKSRPRVALISGNPEWLDTATNLSWKGDSITFMREAGYLLLGITPLKARKLCRRAYEDSEQEVPCIHFTTNG